MSTYWPLCADVFTVLDKIKIAYFLFTERIWTYGEWVKKYEEKWSKYSGVHAIMVSSGSTANELIALRRKWELQKSGDWPRRNRVVFPVNTWISSVSPWINAGFEAVFTDIDPDNLNMMSQNLRPVLDKDPDNHIGTVFYTSLLGFYGDLSNITMLCNSHNARFLMDNCESSFTNVNEVGGGRIVSYATSSTSIFYSHFTTSGTEGGIIFTSNDEEADWFKMARNHGMTRGMPDHYKNPNVHPSFDFWMIGSNYRSSNLQAYMASLDFDRAKKFSETKRYKICRVFHSNLNMSKYATMYGLDYYGVVPLAIPILCRTRDQRIKVETYLKTRGVETRPIIGGCLLAHTAFKGYGDPKDFPNAMWSHQCGLYIGIHQNVTIDMAAKLALDLNLI